MLRQQERFVWTPAKTGGFPQVDNAKEGRITVTLREGIKPLSRNARESDKPDGGAGMSGSAEP
eukprot:1185753-Prorocentrum_minimum.AAC.2